MPDDVLIAPSKRGPKGKHRTVGERYEAMKASNLRRQAVIAKARHEFRDHPELELLTTEVAFVDDAVRQAGMPAVNES